MELLLKIKRVINNKLIKGGCELFLVIISIFVVSYAWFVKTTKNETNDFPNFDIKCSYLCIL